MNCWEAWNAVDQRVATIIQEENNLRKFIGEGGQITDESVKIHTLLKFVDGQEIPPEDQPTVRSFKKGQYDRDVFKEDHLFLDIVEQVHEKTDFQQILVGTMKFSEFFMDLLEVDPAICIAGGAVFSAVTNRPFKDVNDFDLFLLQDPSSADPKERIKNLLNKLHQIYRINQVSFTANAVTAYTSKGYQIQIILREYQHPAEVLIGFDIDCCCFGFAKFGNEIRYFTTDRGLYSLETSTNYLDTDRVSPSYDYRIFKYATRGFAFRVPGLLRTQYLESIPALLTASANLYKKPDAWTNGNDDKVIDRNGKILFLRDFSYLPRLILMENFQTLANINQRIIDPDNILPPPEDYFPKTKHHVPEYAVMNGLHEQLVGIGKSDYDDIANLVDHDNNIAKSVRQKINAKSKYIEICGTYTPKIFDTLKTEIKFKTTNPGEQGSMFTGSFQPLKVSFTRWTQSFFNQLFSDIRLVTIYKEAIIYVAESLGLMTQLPLNQRISCPLKAANVSPRMGRLLNMLFNVGDLSGANQIENGEKSFDTMPFAYEMIWLRNNLDDICASDEFRKFDEVYPDFRSVFDSYLKMAELNFFIGAYNRYKFTFAVAAHLQKVILRCDESGNLNQLPLLPGYFSVNVSGHKFTQFERPLEDPRDFYFYFKISSGSSSSTYKIVSDGINDTNFYFVLDVIQKLLLTNNLNLGIFKVFPRSKNPSRITNVFIPWNLDTDTQAKVYMIDCLDKTFSLASAWQGTNIGLNFLESIGFISFSTV